MATENRPVVLVTSRSFSSGSRDLEGELTSRGFRVVWGQATHDLPSLEGVLEHAVAWIAGTGPVLAEHFARAPRLRVVARYGVGIDSVDLAAASEHGVVVTNTPGANSDAVADYALALLLAVLRGITTGDRRVRSSNWRASRGRDMRTLTVGVVGLGRVGQGVCRRLTGFGSRIIVADPYVSDADIARFGAERSSFEQMAARCDAVTLHAPGGKCLVNEDWLSNVCSPLVLVNTARADLVDEAALAAAIARGAVVGYGADTLAHEFGQGSSSPLLDNALADRVVVTPHAAAQTVEAIDAMGATVMDDVVAVLEGRPPIHRVLLEAP